MQVWQPLSIEGQRLNPAVEVLHHAAQLVSMLSNSYLPKLTDGSQNNLGWNPINNRMEGRWIQTSIRLSLDVTNFELIIEQPAKNERIKLDGWSKDQIIETLKLKIKETDLDPNLLHAISHFSIPDHAVDGGSPFVKPKKEILKEWSYYQSNAQHLLEEAKLKFQWASEVRIWPHHFDTGLYVPLSRDEQGNDTQSIGLGLAIADASVREPYFYINHWSKELLTYPDLNPEIRYGYWTTKDWKGFVLPASAIMQPNSNQEKLVRMFFQDGINASLRLLKKEALISLK